MEKAPTKVIQPKSVRLAESAIFAAVYAALTMVLGYLGYGIIQFRVSDAMITLSALFGWPMIAGVTLGCFVANFYSFVLFPGPAILDVVFGTLANLAASTTVYVLRRWPPIGAFAATVIVTAVVGSYLPLLTGYPYPIAYLTVFIGSLIAILILGLVFLSVFRRIGMPPQLILRED